ncbi:MAG: hypothetical protein L3J39_16715 [Verrucomicrobiales bacterium]|nr:hypothetical protein [Verrucomicrobiales bacterium]
MNEPAIEDLLSDLKSFDDMDIEWPTGLLLRALDFPLMTRNSLNNYHLKERTQITLSEVFELIISSQEHPREGYLICPILGIRHVGKKSFFYILDSMNSVDFGKKCGRAWHEKYERYLAFHRVIGRMGSQNSFAITEKGKTMYPRVKNKKFPIPESKSSLGSVSLF